ncbi:hypothetical protein VA7868_00233 [Vibrio aerogenes CECT 7868]|uniref:Uncharacterized protein n=1 Tax=Vibrio aerogenes CECT 7868 TaxID=1216006 RepID=A0A1M5V0H0_9VIBR|nr:hypothetical protein [Vibrio aerogenes]SHH68634.1 hypothetical protein VA7868_00233 [Vibrio aerogenes CECT 7868]
MKNTMSELESIIDDTELAILALTSTMLCENVGVCALQKLLAGVSHKAKVLLELETSKKSEKSH